MLDVAVFGLDLMDKTALPGIVWLTNGVSIHYDLNHVDYARAFARVKSDLVMLTVLHVGSNQSNLLAL